MAGHTNAFITIPCLSPANALTQKAANEALALLLLRSLEEREVKMTITLFSVIIPRLVQLSPITAKKGLPVHACWDLTVCLMNLWICTGNGKSIRITEERGG